MIQLIVEILRSAGMNPGFFRLVDFVTFRALMAMATALALSVWLGFPVIVFLYRRLFRDTSGELLSLSQGEKRGTPTGGGLLILLTALASMLLWGDLDSPYFLPLTLGFAFMGMVGFVDDFLKARFKSSLVGLGQLAKTALQLLFAIPFAVYFVSPASPVPEELRTAIFIPFYKSPVVDLGAIGFLVFASFAIFSIINAVNITDGMDGLVAGTSVLSLGVYSVFAYVLGHTVFASYLLFPYVAGVQEVAVFGAVLIGAILGFLWYNAFPAMVFMGDTGSLSIGGAIAMMALFVKQEMLFLIVGGLFVLEIFTSLVQDKVGMRVGRRIVHRAPFHYAVSHRGIPEPKVVVRLWIASLVLAAIGLLSLKVR
jgi:phospho-N-acetylmuramoyl-pentapeptide-transferase